MTRVNRLSIGERYFRWLYEQTGLPQDTLPTHSYANVCYQMHKIPFAALVPHDDNRIGDVTALRQLFQEEEHIREPLDQNDLMFPDATILEVLIGLAKRATFMVGKGEGWWFDLFIKNLGLVKYNDIFCTDNSSRWIVRVLDKFNNREYKADGTGGLFPLKIPNQDQRQVELWYQMGAYMTENLMY